MLRAPIIPARYNTARHETIRPTFRHNGDPAEIAKFEASAHRFWDVDGEFKPLHKLNPVRARYIAGARARSRARACSTWDAAAACWPKAGARRRAGHGHRPRAEHGRDRAPACADSGPARSTTASRPPRALLRCPTPASSTSSPAWRCSSTCRIRPPSSPCSRAGAPGGARVRLDDQPQPQVLRARDRRRRIPRASAAARHARIRAPDQPSEIARLARAAGARARGHRRPAYDPFASSARSTRDPSVNYLVHLSAPRRPHAT